MKSLLLAILSLCFVGNVVALTPHVCHQAPCKTQPADVAGLATMLGTVQDGDKLRFVTDQRAWNVDGNSYFAISLEPGVHHLCAVLGKKVDAEPLTVAAGKTYYFQVAYRAEGTQYGTSEHPNYQVIENVEFSMLDEDNGKYRVKASALSIAIPKHP
jgi:hypothetical protein